MTQAQTQAQTDTVSTLADLELAARTEIVRVALTWIGTPFHDCAGVKGVGVDCAYFPIRVVNESGIMGGAIPDPAPYSPQVMLHSHEELYLPVIARYAREISERAVGPGDFVLYRVARSFSHGAIVVRWPDYVLHPVRDRGVIGSHGKEEGFLRRRERRYFTLF